MKRLLLLLIPLALWFSATAQATDHFIVQCAYSHSLPDDPIVFPGMPGASHLHDFMGNTSTDANSTLQNMLGQPTTCGIASDTAAYWMPAMWLGNTRYVPKYTRVYYARDAPAGVTVIPFPPGTQMIAGDKNRLTPSPGIVNFSCGAGTPGDANNPGQPPYDCTPYLGGDDSRDGLVGRVIFPHCWDQNGTAPTDFTGYTATCPTGTKYVPRIRMGFHYFALGATPTNTTFGSTPGEIPWTGLHADFFNAWVQSALQTEITNCINKQPNSCSTFFGKKVGDPGTPTP